MVDFSKIEDKWKIKFKEEKVSESEPNNKPKYFLIWAYPNVSGFHHVGHMRGYSYTDMISRYKKLCGYNTLLTAGGHASGNNGYAKSEKVKNRDEKTIKYYEDMGLTEKELEIISTPEGFVDFFTRRYQKDYEDFGFLVDNRRFAVTIKKDYNKFIEWQFKKLKENNMLLQKPYYATWSKESGAVAVDPSETDLSKGGNAQKNEYTLLKFKIGKEFFVAATLRPETIYGQTNLWVNLKSNYTKIKVGDEIWIASLEFAKKIGYQKEDVKILDKINIKDYIGKYVLAPGLGKNIPILPCKFLDPDIGSGVVTSVPSDAPVDYIALKDLNEKKCEELGIDKKIVEDIELIPIIKSKGFSNYPAKDLVEKYGVKDQLDEKLEDIKKEVYKKGFHTGVMLETSKEFSGMKVEQAKDKVKKKLIQENLADIFYDLSQEVICRNNGRVYIKKFDSQWFINYSNENIKEKAKSYIFDMNIYPQEFKNNLPKIIDWFEDRACARQGKWLGTKLPFDKSYVVEPIADSTLYPIFYLISKYTNNQDLKSEDLTEEFFDYVFLDKKTELSSSILDIANKIKADVNYWYPLDLNVGGKEHQTVHFPVYLMNHVSILNKNMWPKGIFVNWWVVGKGGKISKSKGGAKSIQDEAKTYGVDSMRLFYANAASPYADIEFDPEKIKIYKQRLEKIYYFVENERFEGKEDLVDKWLEAKFAKTIKSIKNNMENFEFRAATDDIYFNLYNDFNWYKVRGGDNKKLIEKLYKEWFKCMSIFTPFIAEELYSKFCKDLACIQEFNKNIELDDNNLLLENIIVQTEKDIKAVLELANLKKLNEIKIIVSSDWKYDFYMKLFEDIKSGSNPKELISKYMQEYKDKEVLKTIQRSNKGFKKVLDKTNELKVLKSSQEFFEKRFEAKVIIEDANRSDEKKAKIAIPSKPAIIVK